MEYSLDNVPQFDERTTGLPFVPIHKGFTRNSTNRVATHLLVVWRGINYTSPVSALFAHRSGTRLLLSTPWIVLLVCLRCDAVKHLSHDDDRRMLSIPGRTVRQSGAVLDASIF